MSKKILLVDDDPIAGEQIDHFFSSKDWAVTVANDVAKAHQFLFEEELNPNVVIVDYAMSKDSDLEKFHELNDHADDSEWIYLLDPADGIDRTDLEDSAFEVLEKPVKLKRLDLVAKRAHRASLTTKRLASYASSDSKRYQLDAYVGSSARVLELKDMIKRLADVPISTMVITGETGTGKGLAARIIHNTGLRKDGPMVELNCAALPKDLMESEMFGHEAGAFTGAKGRYKGIIEQADGGTLFLDEIGDLELDLQAKLLKAIEDKRIRRLGGEREISIDVQIIAATAKNLESAVQQNDFRSDLLHRLNVFSIRLPPLRERKEDIVEMVPRIVAEYNQKANRTVEIIPDAVWEKLLAHDWPGNIRELRNVIERCVLLSSDATFPQKWLQLGDTDPTQVSHDANDTTEGVFIPLDGTMALEEMDSHIIQSALELHDHNVTETARVLGTTRETLRYRIQKYGINSSQ